MAINPTSDEHSLLLRIIEGLQPYDDDNKLRLIRTVLTYFNLSNGSATFGAAAFTGQTAKPSEERPSVRRMQFSGHSEMSPKEFLKEKSPRTEVERVACLAYYLMHYRDVMHFKTQDINNLNTEAAQAKLSNPSYAVDNATKAGFLASAGKGLKQLSANGEHYIDALPDRDAAQAIRDQFLRKKAKKRTVKRKSNGQFEISDDETNNNIQS